MRFSIEHGDTFPTLDFVLDPGDEVHAEPDSMLCMDPGVVITATTGGIAKRGIGGGFRSMLAGESMFRTVFTAKRDGQRLSLAPGQIGDIVHVRCTDADSWFLARGAYLANGPGVTVTVEYGGAKGVMAQTGLFFMRASGEGDVFCTSHGRALRRELAEGERFVLDNRYTVAFSTSVTYEIVKATDGIVTSLMSGEGLVTRFKGPGTVVYQTRAGAKGGRGFMSMLIDVVF